jgi:hypothetical protein
MNNIKWRLIAMATATLCARTAGAYSFDAGDGAIQGTLNSTVAVGIGIRTANAPCNTIVGSDVSGSTPGGGTPTGTSASGCLDALAGYNDQGNLNYNKGHAFTEYLKGTHELLLKFPNDYKFMARVNWIKDFAATSVSGAVSGYGGQGLTSDSHDQLASKVRLLDLWVSKEFEINDQRARLRIGNQVINWGESMFLAGGINQTNAVDLMRLSQPGTQLKEAMLPAPMASFATGLGHGLNMEAYVQTHWNRNYFPPVGSYWSTSTIGNGASSFANGTPNVAMPTGNTPRNGGQYGVALHYKPESIQADMGFYAMRYHDKSPVAVTPNGGATQFTYLQDRLMLGTSINFPLGDWAIGSELSYRPRDAVSLNPLAVGCPDNKCYAETKKFQLAVTGMLTMSPTDYTVARWLGASSATLMAEAVMVHYPELKSSYNGAPLAAGSWLWGALTSTDSFFANGSVPSQGTNTSWGYNLDFNWTYDGTLIPGWQVTPEVYYFQAVRGRTPNSAALFMQGAKSANFTVTFTQNPAKWLFGVNYAMFWGGDQALDQPLRGRNFVGAYVARNF